MFNQNQKRLNKIIFFQKKLNNNYLGCMVLSKNYNNSLREKLSNLKIQKNGYNKKSYIRNNE